MKILRVASLAALISAAATFVATAQNVSITAGSIGWLDNATGAPQTKLTTAAPVETSSPITNAPDPVLDPYLNGSYLLKLAGGANVKVGLALDDAIGTIPVSLVQINRQEPYADLSYGALSARVSFPLYEFGLDTVNDGSNAEIGYILNNEYKGIYLSWDQTNPNTFLFTNFESVSYKFTLDPTHAIVLNATTEIGLSPAWIYDVKPQVSFVLGPLQLDLRESIYFADSGSTTPSYSDSTFNVEYFTDPKLTIDFSTLGLAGFKAYLAPSIYTFDSVPNSSLSAWYGGVDGSGKAIGSSITQGFSYTHGPWYFETALKYHNYDDTVYNAGGKATAIDAYVNGSYTVKF